MHERKVVERLANMMCVYSSAAMSDSGTCQQVPWSHEDGTTMYSDVW